MSGKGPELYLLILQAVQNSLIQPQRLKGVSLVSMFLLALIMFCSDVFFSDTRVFLFEQSRKNRVFFLLLSSARKRLLGCASQYASGNIT